MMIKMLGRLNTTMKFKGQGKINICGFEYKKNIADSRGGGGGVRAPKQKNLYPRLGPYIFNKLCAAMDLAKVNVIHVVMATAWLVIIYV